MARYTPTLLFCLLLPLSAQEKPGFGVHAALEQPLTGLRRVAKDLSGYSLGVHATWRLTDHLTLRPQLSYARFDSKPRNFTSYNSWDGTTWLGHEEHSTSKLSLGADALLHLRRDGLGFYLVSGVALDHWMQSLESSGLGPIDGTNSPKPWNYTRKENWQGLALSVGAGYQFNRAWGAEMKYTTSSGPSTLGSAYNSVQIGTTFRFK